MQRALDMLKSGERLDKICENIRHDSAYKRKSQFRSHREIERRRAERTEQKKANRVRKARHKAVRRAEQAARQAEGTSAAVATAAAD